MARYSGFSFSFFSLSILIASVLSYPTNSKAIGEDLGEMSGPSSSGTPGSSNEGPTETDCKTLKKPKKCWACLYQKESVCAGTSQTDCNGRCLWNGSDCVAKTEYQCRAYIKNICKNGSGGGDTYDQCFAYPTSTPWSTINEEIEENECDETHVSKFYHSHRDNLGQLCTNIRVCASEGYTDYKDWGCQTLRNLSDVFDSIAKLRDQANQNGSCLNIEIQGNQCDVNVWPFTNVEPGDVYPMSSSRIQFQFCGKRGNPCTVEAGPCYSKSNPKVFCGGGHGTRPTPDPVAFCYDEEDSSRPYGDDILINGCMSCSDCQEGPIPDSDKTYWICKWAEGDMSDCEDDHGTPGW